MSGDLYHGFKQFKDLDLDSRIHYFIQGVRVGYIKREGLVGDPSPTWAWSLGNEYHGTLTREEAEACLRAAARTWLSYHAQAPLP